MQEQRFEILVVDDDEGVRDSLKIILEDEYKVWAVDGGRRALDLFKKVKPDLVFLDMVLPDMNGFQVLKQMKLMYPMTPIVIFTAYSNMSDALHAIESGASDYIPKPFSVAEIRRRAAELLGNGNLRPLDCERLRQRWMTRKRSVRERFLNSSFVPSS
jgi:two-component system response regulator MtrA